MYDGYHWMLFFHILAAAIWFGGALVTQMYAILATRTEDPNRVAMFAKDAEWIGLHVFMPSSFVLVALGFGLVADGPWSMGDAWVAFGLAVWILSAVTGAAFLGPEAGRINRVVADQGVASEEAQRRIRRIFVISRIELTLLLLAIFAMVIKPG